MKRIELQAIDIKVLVIVAATLVIVAWGMSMFDIVYAPLPMFTAAIIGGVIFRGTPKQASIIGALAGLTGGAIAEIAYHLERMERFVSWMQLTSTEQIWLAFAETLLYASLLSFFMAFFSWSAHPKKQSIKLDLEKHPLENEPGANIELPLFKPQIGYDEDHQEQHSSDKFQSKMSTPKKN